MYVMRALYKAQFKIIYKVLQIRFRYSTLYVCNVDG